MKIEKPTFTRLAVGCLLALGLVQHLGAQIIWPVGTFHSAKDPDLPPLPFNLYPDLPATEVAKGIFVVDDTGVSDTEAQAISRLLRQAAAERAKALASDPATAKAVQEAQIATPEQVAAFQAKYGAAIVPGTGTDELPHPKTPDEIQRVWDDCLQRDWERYQRVTNYLARIEREKESGVTNEITFLDPYSQTPVPPSDVDNVGQPVFLLPHGLAQNVTTGARNVQTNTNPSIGFNATNVTLQLWEGGEPNIAHQEFGGRLTILQPASLLLTNASHATHVSGIMIARGVNQTAMGVLTNAAAGSFDYDNSPPEVAAVASTDPTARVGNHSYGEAKVGWGGTSGYSIITRPGGSWQGTVSLWNGFTNVSTVADTGFGLYDQSSAAMDGAIYSNKTYSAVYSAGNERAAGANQPAGTMPVTVTYKTF